MSNISMLPGPAGLLETIYSVPKISSVNDVILLCHPHPLFGGTMQNKVVTTLERTFKKMNFVTLRFNYRGVGQSEGQYGEGTGEAEDALQLLTWLQTQHPKAKVWIAGFSFGGYVAARAASLFPVKQLVTVAPSVEHFNFNALKSIKCPWLVVQGEADEIVSPQAVYDFVERYQPKPDLIRLLDTSHFFHGQLITLQELMTDYFS